MAFRPCLCYILPCPIACLSPCSAANASCRLRKQHAALILLRPTSCASFVDFLPYTDISRRACSSAVLPYLTLQLCMQDKAEPAEVKPGSPKQEQQPAADDVIPLEPEAAVEAASKEGSGEAKEETSPRPSEEGAEPEKLHASEEKSSGRGRGKGRGARGRGRGRGRSAGRKGKKASSFSLASCHLTPICCTSAYGMRSSIQCRQCIQSYTSSKPSAIYHLPA